MASCDFEDYQLYAPRSYYTQYVYAQYLNENRICSHKCCCCQQKEPEGDGFVAFFSFSLLFGLIYALYY